MPGNVHSGGIPSEYAANEKSTPGRHKLREEIFRAVADAGQNGLLIDEFSLTHGVLFSTAARRFYELWHADRIRHHPTYLERKNRAGNDCVTWVVGKDPNRKGRLSLGGNPFLDAGRILERYGPEYAEALCSAFGSDLCPV